VINRGLDVYSFGGKGSEQVCEPVIFSCCIPPYRIITRVKNRDPSAAILRHRFLFPEIDVVSLSASQIDFVHYEARWHMEQSAGRFSASRKSLELTAALLSYRGGSSPPQALTPRLIESVCFTPGTEKNRLRSTPKTEPAIIVLTTPMRDTSN